ncbi:MAG: LTA synthase family protein [bacterium]|nr:LTA synthase family protein [bacterium]
MGGKMLKDKIKTIIRFLSKKIAAAYVWVHKKPFIECGIIACLVNLIVSIFCLRSIWQAMVYIVIRPHLFIYNALIIFACLSVSMFFKKKYFFIALISVVWIGLGVSNFVLQCMRVTPLEAVDFQILKTGLDIIDIYVSPLQLTLIIIAIVLVVAALVFFWFIVKKQAVNFLKSIICSVSSVVIIVLLTTMFLATNILPGRFVSLTKAYREYGFVYCFLSSVFDRGISKPDNYSEETVENIVQEISSDKSSGVKKKPNIIMIQLESFFDPNRLEGVTYSQDPTPNFTRLKKDCASGYVYVPSIGAGTANTEFEVLCGMSLEYFGNGEYPYKTVLQTSTCESMAYNLKELDYNTHAIHNHTGTFYDRNLIYSNLGFDTFTSVEYMDNIERTEKGWAKDYVLTDEIFKVLNSTKEQDFVFTVTVQGHGKYPEEQAETPPKVLITGGVEEEKELNQLQYYVNQLHETDEFIAQLLERIKKFEEDTVVVMYGDHFPSFNWTDDDLNSGNLFQTDYIVWSNYKTSYAEKDITTYQLSAQVLDLVGMDNGIITKLHQNYSKHQKYLEALETLQYDMLYGDKTVYKGVSPYEKTDIKMGTRDIVIEDIRVIGDFAYIIGDGFTTYSRVVLNDKECDVTFISKNTLQIESSELNGEANSIYIRQETGGGTLLSRTDPYNF